MTTLKSKILCLGFLLTLFSFYPRVYANLGDDPKESSFSCITLALSHDLLDESLLELKESKKLYGSDDTQRVLITNAVIFKLASIEADLQKHKENLDAFEKRLQRFIASGSTKGRNAYVGEHRSLVTKVEEAQAAKNLVESLQKKSPGKFYTNFGIRLFPYSKEIFLDLIKNKDQYLKRQDCQFSETKLENLFPFMGSLLTEAEETLEAEKNVCSDSYISKVDFDFLCPKYAISKRENLCTQETLKLSLDSYMENDLKCYSKLMNEKLLIYDKDALNKRLSEITSIVPHEYLVKALKGKKVTPKIVEHACVKNALKYKSDLYTRLNQLVVALAGRDDSIMQKINVSRKAIEEDFVKEYANAGLQLSANIRASAKYAHTAHERSLEEIEQSLNDLALDYDFCNKVLLYEESKKASPEIASLVKAEELKTKAKDFFDEYGLDADIFDSKLKSPASLKNLLSDKGNDDILPGHKIDISKAWEDLRKEELGKIANYCFTNTQNSDSLKDDKNHLQNLFKNNTGIKRIGKREASKSYLFSSALRSMSSCMQTPKKDMLSICLKKWQKERDVKEVFSLGELNLAENKKENDDFLKKVSDMAKTILFEKFNENITETLLDASAPSLEEVPVDEKFLAKLHIPEDIGNIFTRKIPDYFDKEGWDAKTLQEKTEQVLEKVKREKKIGRVAAAILRLAGVIKDGKDFESLRQRIETSAQASLLKRNKARSQEKNLLSEELISLKVLDSSSLKEFEEELSSDLKKQQTSNAQNLITPRASERLNAVFPHTLESFHGLSQDLWLASEYYFGNDKTNLALERDVSKDALRIVNNEYLSSGSWYGTDEEFYNMGALASFFKSLPIVPLGQGIGGILELPEEAFVDLMANHYGETREEFLEASQDSNSPEALALLAYQGAQLLVGTALTGWTGVGLKGARLFTAAGKAITPLSAIKQALLVNTIMSAGSTFGQELTLEGGMSLDRGLRNFVKQMSASSLFGGVLGAGAKLSISSRALNPTNAALLTMTTDVADGMGDLAEVMSLIDLERRNWIEGAEGNTAKIFGLSLQAFVALADVGGDQVANGLYHRLKQMGGNTKNSHGNLFFSATELDQLDKDHYGTVEKKLKSKTVNPKEKEAYLKFAKDRVEFLLDYLKTIETNSNLFTKRDVTRVNKELAKFRQLISEYNAEKFTFTPTEERALERNGLSAIEEKLRSKSTNPNVKDLYFKEAVEHSYILAELVKEGEGSLDPFFTKSMKTWKQDLIRYRILIDEFDTPSQRKERLLRKGITEEEVIQNAKRSSSSMDSNRETVEAIFETKLSDEMWNQIKPSIIYAHNTGSGTIFNYSRRDLAAKRKILSRAGISSEHISKLMDYGIVGRPEGSSGTNKEETLKERDKIMDAIIFFDLRPMDFTRTKENIHKKIASIVKDKIDNLENGSSIADLTTINSARDILYAYAEKVKAKNPTIEKILQKEIDNYARRKVASLMLEVREETSRSHTEEIASSERKKTLLLKKELKNIVTDPSSNADIKANNLENIFAKRNKDAFSILSISLEDIRGKNQDEVTKILDRALEQMTQNGQALSQDEQSAYTILNHPSSRVRHINSINQKNKIKESLRIKTEAHDYYAVLGLNWKDIASKRTTREQYTLIKSAYETLKVNTSGDDFHSLNSAYSFLIDRAQREKYNNELRIKEKDRARPHLQALIGQTRNILPTVNVEDTEDIKNIAKDVEDVVDVEVEKVVVDVLRSEMIRQTTVHETVSQNKTPLLSLEAKNPSQVKAPEAVAIAEVKSNGPFSQSEMDLLLSLGFSENSYDLKKKLPSKDESSKIATLKRVLSIKSETDVDAYTILGIKKSDFDNKTQEEIQKDINGSGNGADGILATALHAKNSKFTRSQIQRAATILSSVNGREFHDSIFELATTENANKKEEQEASRPSLPQRSVSQTKNTNINSREAVTEGLRLSTSIHNPQIISAPQTITNSLIPDQKRTSPITETMENVSIKYLSPERLKKFNSILDSDFTSEEYKDLFEEEFLKLNQDMAKAHNESIEDDDKYEMLALTKIKRLRSSGILDKKDITKAHKQYNELIKNSFINADSSNADSSNAVDTLAEITTGDLEILNEILATTFTKNDYTNLVHPVFQRLKILASKKNAIEGKILNYQEAAKLLYSDDYGALLSNDDFKIAEKQVQDLVDHGLIEIQNENLAKTLVSDAIQRTMNNYMINMSSIKSALDANFWHRGEVKRIHEIANGSPISLSDTKNVQTLFKLIDQIDKKDWEVRKFNGAVFSSQIKNFTIEHETFSNKDGGVAIWERRFYQVDKNTKLPVIHFIYIGTHPNPVRGNYQLGYKKMIDEYVKGRILALGNNNLATILGGREIIYTSPEGKEIDRVRTDGPKVHSN